jgi:hypothetical protein
MVNDWTMQKDNRIVSVAMERVDADQLEALLFAIEEITGVSKHSRRTSRNERG